MLPLTCIDGKALSGYCDSCLTLSNYFLSGFRFSSYHIVLHCPAVIYVQHFYVTKGTDLQR
jgi:hypothetical protein